MTRTLDMQFIRYMNLFSRVSRVSARHCFSYNNMLIFVVPAREVKTAIGPNNSNLQQLSKILLKRIRVVAQPDTKSAKDVGEFITTIISPVTFNSLDVNGDEVKISADMEGKARLIGRQRVREKELAEILDQYFGIKKLSIV